MLLRLEDKPSDVDVVLVERPVVLSEKSSELLVAVSVLVMPVTEESLLECVLEEEEDEVFVAEEEEMREWS